MQPPVPVSIGTLEVFVGESNEAKPPISHCVCALDPVDDASLNERYDPRPGRVARGRGINPDWGARAGAMAVWSAAAQRTAVRAHHHAHRVDPCDRHACCPRDGSGRHFSRRDCQVQPSLFIRMDASRVGRDWDLHLHPVSARTVELATGQTPVATGRS
jgi:hypothetical protein